MTSLPSHAGVPIGLPVERWRHLTVGHPELADGRERVVETPGAPVVIQAGDQGEPLTLRCYEQTPFTFKHRKVVYRETSARDDSALTTSFTHRLSGRSVTLWKRLGAWSV